MNWYRPKIVEVRMPFGIMDVIRDPVLGNKPAMTISETDLTQKTNSTNTLKLITDAPICKTRIDGEG